MTHYINAEQLKAELDKRYTEYRAKMKTDDFTYYEGMADALDHFEQYIDSLPKQLVDITSAGSGAMGTVPPKFKLDVKPAEVDLEKELEEEIERFYRTDEYRIADALGCGFETLARHFAEWGARHSINWGDVQLLDTFILELSREEKDGADWGDSEKFYTEVLRRFHEFNDKKIPEIVAEWSEKDEDMLNSCISSIEEAKENRYAYKETDGDTSYDHEIAWLKLLRNRVGKEFLQPHWKPSEEQMMALLEAMQETRPGWLFNRQLVSLYDDLKKL